MRDNPYLPERHHTGLRRWAIPVRPDMPVATSSGLSKLEFLLLHADRYERSGPAALSCGPDGANRHHDHRLLRAFQQTSTYNTCACQPVVQDQDYQSCPSGESGQIYDEITYNCDGSTSTQTVNNCAINITAPTLCPDGSTVYGIYQGGVLEPCTDSECIAYTCTAAGLVAQ